MKPEAIGSSTPLAENVSPRSDLKFLRGCPMYSSLPNHTLKQAPKTDTGDQMNNDLRLATSRNINSIVRSDENREAPIAPNFPSSSSYLSDNVTEHSFGLSNNLSTESIRKACEFYDDELSDDDLIETQSIPECFQKQSSIHKSIKGLYFNIGQQRTNKNTKDLASCKINEEANDNDHNGSGTSFFTGSKERGNDDAVNALKELDEVLDIEGAAKLCTSCPVNYEIESKIEDCLLDLDNYLEKMDDCCTAFNDQEKIYVENDLSKRLPIQVQKNFFPTTSVLEMAGRTDLDEAAGGTFQRGHGLRKTISCGLEKKCEALEAPYTTSHRLKESKRCNKGRCRNSMRITAQFMLPGGSSSPNHNKSTASLGEGTKSERNKVEAAPAEASIAEHDILTECNDAELASYSALNGDQNLRRCFSQSDFCSRNFPANPNQILTQDNIFYNLLAQNGANPRREDRPRQFGRRSEGYPRIMSIRPEMLNENNSCMIVNYDQRPMSAPAANSAGPIEEIIHPERQTALFIGSASSSIRSSHNHSPISLVSSTDSSSTVVSTNVNMESTLVATNNLQSLNLPLDPENTHLRAESEFHKEWPHSFSRLLALIPCTLGVFNLCRFAVLTEIYGGNFLLQFLLLSILFGIPLLWLQMCLGAKIRSGPVSIWKISPICKGIGISLVIVQCFITIYSTVALAWILVYLKDSFPSKAQVPYAWQQDFSLNRQASNSSSNITEWIGNYFNVIVLQRFQFGGLKRTDGNYIRFRVSDRLAFNLAILWTAVFLILCKGLKSFGKVVFGISTLPLIVLVVVTCKFLYIVDPSKIQNIFSSSDFDDFLINSKTWSAAAQEAFLTWGLMGASVISITSRSHAKGNNKSALRRDAILLVLVTFFGLSVAALLGLCCVQILNQHSFVYVPGSYERPESYSSVYSLKTSTNTDVLSFPMRWVPHYSSFIGETYRRPSTDSHRESGYQGLRFITELFPAAITLSKGFSWIWTVIAFAMFATFGLAQLCVMWKPIASALGNSTSALLLTCVTGLLLSIPFTTEIGISILHYMDLVLGGSWFIPILWTAEIFGVFLIRGRPYNGDDLVNDLRMSGSMSAFLALSWNVLLPIGLITLAVVDYKTSFSSEFYYWRGRSYFTYWARKVAGLTQVGFLLLVPIAAIVQIYRYLTKGPPDILDRIQLLYRPSEEVIENRVDTDTSRNRNDNSGQGINALGNTDAIVNHAQDDAPPKYTPPPSYTTATGARLAKMLRQSIRRSVRRILRAPATSRLTFSNDSEVNLQTVPPDYSNGSDQAIRETIEIAQRPLDSPVEHNQRSLSLGRKVFSQKHQGKNDNRPSSASPALGRSTNLQRPYTAEDVVTILRSSTRVHQTPGSAASSFSQEWHDMRSQNDNSFCSVENLILNMEPLGQSLAVGICDTNTTETNNE